MLDISDKILVGPSKQKIEVVGLLSNIKEYDSLSKVPKEIISKIRENISEEEVLSLWVLKGYGFGRIIKYSIEDKNTAESTQNLHKEDYRAQNPMLMKLYTKRELESLIGFN